MARKKVLKKSSIVMLNSAGSEDSGIIGWTIRASNQDGWVDAGIDVWDCTRKASLSFSTTGGTLKERIRKADRMIQCIREFRKALVAAQPLQVEGKKYQKEKAKKRKRVQGVTRSGLRAFELD